MRAGGRQPGCRARGGLLPRERLFRCYRTLDARRRSVKGARTGSPLGIPEMTPTGRALCSICNAQWEQAPIILECRSARASACRKLSDDRRGTSRYRLRRGVTPEYADFGVRGTRDSLPGCLFSTHAFVNSCGWSRPHMHSVPGLKIRQQFDHSIADGLDIECVDSSVRVVRQDDDHEGRKIAFLLQ
jgi:hypothetical protein